MELRVVPVAGAVRFSGPTAQGEARVRGGRRVGGVLAGQEAAGQRVVGDHADVLLAAQRKQFVLDLAEQHVVARLHALEAGRPQLVALPQGEGQAPRLEVGAADVPHLPLVDEVVQRAQRFVDRGARVGRVHLVEIDVVGLQAPQTRLDRGEDVLAGQSAVVGPGAHRAPTFGRQHDVIASAFQPFADDLFGTAGGLDASARGIDVRGVEEIDAVFEGGVHDGEARSLVAL